MAGLMAVFAGAAPTGAAGGIAQAGAAGGGPTGGGGGATGGGGGATAGAIAVAAVAAAGNVKPQAAQNLCPASVRGAPQLGQKPNPVVIRDPSDLPFPRPDKVSRASRQNRASPPSSGMCRAIVAGDPGRERANRPMAGRTSFSRPGLSGAPVDSRQACRVRFRNGDSNQRWRPAVPASRRAR
jgi:hypothetical protein